MDRKKTKVKAADRRKPVRSVEPAPAAPAPKTAAPKPANEFAAQLARACSVCEARATLTRYSHVVFEGGRFQATDGVIQVQGHSTFAPESSFSLSEEKLAQALALIDPVEKIEETTEMVKLSRGPLAIRVKKKPAELGFFDPFKISKGATKADGLLETLRLVEPFMSEDATRPWSVSVLIANGYAWATNNLALVRSPLATPYFSGPISIPLPAVRHLCLLDRIDYVEEAQPGRVTLLSGRLLYRFSAGAAGWPDLAPFFAKMPKKMTPLPPEMKDAAAVTKRLSDRFVSLDTNRVESKSETVDASYEIDLAKGKGVFSAQILSLIAAVATEAEFSFFPDPIFFRGEKIEGTAVGASTTP